MIKSWVSVFGVFGVILGLGGCATGYPPPSSELLSPASSEYLIGPGDNINVMVWRNPELSMVVPVRPDGKFTTPLVEDLQASG